jgi:rod shape-determining protein MreC
MKPLFTQGPSITPRLVVVVLISLFLMTVDQRMARLEPVRAALSVVIYPLQYLVNRSVSAVDLLSESLSSRRALLDENAKLRAQRLILEARLLRLAALEAENMRLRELLDASLQLAERTVIAELLAVQLDPYKYQVVINKGFLHSVYRGQPLIDAHGVMGQVVHVGPVSSVVILITDPNHALPVQVNRNGLRSIAIGTAAPNRLELPHIPNNGDIREGDLLITSGLAERFPSGYPVAIVTQVEQDPSRPFARVSAAPTARLDRNREVLLVWPRERALVPGQTQKLF